MLKQGLEQLTIFDDAVRKEMREHMKNVVESICARSGKKAITYATLLENLKMSDVGRDSVKMSSMMYQ